MSRLRRRLHAVQRGLPVDERSRRFLQQSCRPCPRFSEGHLLSNTDDAGQLLEFVFATIHSSQARTACVKLALYFCRCGGVRGSLLGFPCFPCQRSLVETESSCALRTTFSTCDANDGRSGSLLPFFKIVGVLRRTKSLFM